MKLDGQIALVTGSGRNLGRAIAIALAREGAAVVLNGLADRVALEDLAHEIEASGGRAHPVLADVADPEAVQGMVDQVARDLGPISVMISNAGIRPHRSLDMDPAEWRRAMAVNLDATYYLCRAIVPGMVSQQHGSIVAIAGAAAFGVRGNAVATATAKAGLIGMMRAVARDYAKDNVRANVVSPGNMATARYDQEAYLAGRPAVPIEKEAADTVSHVPMGRRGRPDEVAAACLYLASDDSSYTTGQVIHVAGGVYMG